MIHRRRFLQNLGALGFGGLAASRGQRARALQASDAGSLLDEMRRKIHDWTQSLWVPESGGFRQSAKVGVNLMSTTDVAMVRYATADSDLRGPGHAAWVNYLRAAQDPQNGVIAYNPPRGGQTHSDGHAMWQTVRSLNILGGQLAHFPHYLRPVMTPEGLERWFDEDRGEASSSNHHNVLGLVPILASRNDQEWAEVFYRKIAEQQNPTNGGWPKSRINISRTFAYSCLHRATGRLPPHAEQIVDTILSLQRENGCWETNPAFLTMDSAFILVRLPPLLNHREQDARLAMQRVGRAFHELLPAGFEAIAAGGTHRMVAIAHTLGFLQEAFPDDFPSQPGYRFNWDKPELFHCDVIAKA